MSIGNSHLEGVEGLVVQNEGVNPCLVGGEITLKFYSKPSSLRHPDLVKFRIRLGAVIKLQDLTYCMNLFSKNLAASFDILPIKGLPLSRH